jgi:hypothetical protein
MNVSARYSEPRWPPFIAVLAVVGLSFALHEDVIFGPRWLLPVVIVGLIVPTMMLHRMKRHDVDWLLGLVISALLTIALIVSVILLVRGLPSHRQSPVALFRSAGSLWCTNILVFALWYWRLDAGGPHLRGSRPTHEVGSFLFVQHEHRVFADGDGTSDILVQVVHDGAVDPLAHHHRRPGSAGREYRAALHRRTRRARSPPSIGPSRRFATFTSALAVFIDIRRTAPRGPARYTRDAHWRQRAANDGFNSGDNTVHAGKLQSLAEFETTHEKHDAEYGESDALHHD